MRSRSTFGRGCLLLITVLAASLGAVLLVLSFLPFGTLKSGADWLASGGSAEFFDRAFLRRIVNVVRLAAALLLCSVPLYLGRRHVGRFLRDLGTSFSSLARDVVRSLRASVATRDRAHLVGFCAIILVAIVLRLCFLWQPMRYDEAFTFQHYASRPLTQGLTDYSYVNNHLFHTLQVHVAYRVLGNRPWVLRLPAFLAGVLLVPASYLAVRALYGKQAALLAAALVAASSRLIEFSALARGYSLLCLIFVLMLALATFLKRRREPAAWAVFAVLAALGFWTIPFMIYPFAAVIAWLVASAAFKDASVGGARLLKDLLVTAAVAVLLAFLLYVPALHFTGVGAVKRMLASTRVSWSRLAPELLASFHTVWLEWHRDIPVAVRAVFVAGFIASLVLHRRVASHRVPVVIVVVLVCLIGLLVQRALPRTRCWLFLLPLYLGVVAAGLSGLIGLVEARLGRHTSTIYAVFGLVLSVGLGVGVLCQRSVYYSTDGGAFREAEELALFFKDELRPSDKVLAVGTPRPSLEYYFDLHGVPLDHLRADVTPDTRVYIVVGQPRNQTLAGVLDKYRLSAPEGVEPEPIGHYESSVLYRMTGLRRSETE